MITECSVEDRAGFGPEAGALSWAQAQPRQLRQAETGATACPAGANEDERQRPLAPPSGMDGAEPCERGAPAIWLLPCILGGGLIWASILVAVL